MPAHAHQFPCLSDNYGALVHDPATGRTASIDAPDAGAVLRALDERGWRLTDILVTHHHADHVGGIPGVKARFPDLRVTAPAKEAVRIGAVDVEVREGSVIAVGDLRAKVIETPGHTAGHIVYWFEDAGLLFAGDTLFSLGCGRVLETPMHVMWESLLKLTRLPGETQVYCGHEYTASNARFALTVDGTNDLLRDRAREVDDLRRHDRPTLPSTIALELATNPFLRAEDRAIAAAVGLPDADPAAVFAELRERKNRA